MTTQTPSIEEQTQAFVTGAAAAMPAEVMGAFAAEQVRLDAAGVPTGVSAPGAVMPDGDLLDIHGAATSLAQVRAGRPAVVVFYRGAVPVLQHRVTHLPSRIGTRPGRSGIRDDRGQPAEARRVADRR